MTERERKRPKSRPLSLSFRKSDRPLTDDVVNDVMRHMHQTQVAADQCLRDAVGKLARESAIACETFKRLSTPPPRPRDAEATESEDEKQNAP